MPLNLGNMGGSRSSGKQLPTLQSKTKYGTVLYSSRVKGTEHA